MCVSLALKRITASVLRINERTIIFPFTSFSIWLYKSTSEKLLLGWRLEGWEGWEFQGVPVLFTLFASHVLGAGNSFGIVSQGSAFPET